MKTRLTSFLLQAGFSFGVIVGLLAVTAGVVYYAQTTLLDIEQTLPVKVLEQEREVALLMNNTSALLSAVKLARFDPSPGNIDDIQLRLDIVDARIKWIRGSYNFDTLIGTSAIHAVANPAIADIKVWLSEGIYGFLPASPPVLKMVETRILDALESMDVLFAEASETASDILKTQSARIDTLRSVIIFVLMVLFTLGAMLVFHVFHRCKSDEALRGSEELFRALYQQSPSGVTLEDYSLVKLRFERMKKSGISDFSQYFQEHQEELSEVIMEIRLLDANHTLIEMFGTKTFEEFQAYEDDIASWKTPNWIEFYIGEFAALAAGLRTYSSELQGVRVDGSVLEIKCTTRVVTNPKDDWSVVITTHDDITARKIATEKLLQQATIDQVTGLPNRALLFDRMSRAIEHARREQRHVGLIFVDLDRFKLVNDSRGHAAGDLLLKKIGQSLSKLVRQEDTVARLGGDEFILLLNDVELPNGPKTVAKKIIDVFSRPFELDGHETYITASLGIAICPEDGADPEVLLQNADAAMYISKHQGRNTFRHYTPGLNDEAWQHGRIAERLRHALERDDLKLYFQPIIDLRSDRVVSVEALIRWDDEILKSIEPQKFIAVAEESGFVLPIDRWVLNESCRQAAAWRAEVAPTLELNVNISISHFRSPGLFRAVQRALKSSGLPAQALTLEITENLLIEDSPKVLQRLKKLSDLGVKLALDDFGTGYSSLGYLKRFQVNTLKIDRSFVGDIADDSGDLALVEAIIAMSRRLGISVVAEGVKTVRQLELLQASGCQLIQGYYYSRPLNNADMTDYLGNPENVIKLGNISKGA